MARRKTDSKNWGGAREGAGRPLTGDAPKVPKSISFDVNLLGVLENLEEQMDMSRSALVNWLVRSGIEREFG